VESYQLNIIDFDHRNSREKCQVMLRQWLRQDVAATWGKLADVADTISPSTGKSCDRMQGVEMSSI